MTEMLKKTQVFRFDQIAVQVKDKVEPAEAKVDRYVGLEHIDPESLRIKRWGETSDVESSKIIFKFGDIIFGKRRAYQRKLAVADFDGICSAHAMVLRPKTDVVLEEFLPFFMQSDVFMDRAVKISVGGLSPTINWRDLAKEEFVLPPLEEQQRMSVVLSSSSKYLDRLAHLADQAKNLLSSFLKARLLQEGAGSLPRYPSVNLQDVAYFQEGPGLRNWQWAESGMKVANATNVVGDGSVNTGNTDKYISLEEFEKTYSHFAVEDADILMVSSGATYGKIGRITEHNLPLMMNTSVIRFHSHDNSVLNDDFLYFYLQSHHFMNQIERLITGSAQPNFGPSHLKQVRIPLPPIGEQTLLAEQLRKLDEDIKRINAKVGDTRKFGILLINRWCAEQ